MKTEEELKMLFFEDEMNKEKKASLIKSIREKVSKIFKVLPLNDIIACGLRNIGCDKVLFSLREFINAESKYYMPNFNDLTCSIDLNTLLYETKDITNSLKIGNSTYYDTLNKKSYLTLLKLDSCLDFSDDNIELVTMYINKQDIGSIWLDYGGSKIIKVKSNGVPTRLLKHNGNDVLCDIVRILENGKLKFHNNVIFPSVCFDSNVNGGRFKKAEVGFGTYHSLKDYIKQLFEFKIEAFKNDKEAEIKRINDSISAYSNQMIESQEKVLTLMDEAKTKVKKEKAEKKEYDVYVENLRIWE